MSIMGTACPLVTTRLIPYLDYRITRSMPNIIFCRAQRFSKRRFLCKQTNRALPAEFCLQVGVYKTKFFPFSILSIRVYNL